MDIVSFQVINLRFMLNLGNLMILYGKKATVYSDSFNGHLYKTDISVKRTLRVGPCLSLLPLFDSLYERHLCTTEIQSWSLPFFTPFISMTLYKTDISLRPTHTAQGVHLRKS